MIASPLKNAETLFLAEEDHGKTGSSCLAVIEAGNLLALAQDFLDAGFHLEDVSGLDAAEGAVSIYHFDHFDQPCRATVLVVAPHDKAVFPSIAAVYQGAEWHERETRDFFGYTYENNPNLIPLLLPDDMADVHPLAKGETARAPLAALFSAEGRDRAIVRKADSFTLLDVPVKEEPAPAPAVKAEPAPEAKEAETPKVGTAKEAKAEVVDKPEEKTPPKAESVEKAAAPAAQASGTPGPAPETEQTAEAKAEIKPEPKTGAKPATETDVKGKAKPTAKPAAAASPKASAKAKKSAATPVKKKGAGNA